MILGFNSLWTLGLVVACQVLVSNAGDSVPVYLWGGDGENSSPEPVNPLHKTSQVDFKKILSRKLGKSLPPLLVFVRDSFCVEDLTQNKENLKKLKNAGTIYLPAVESPMSVFENLPSYNLTMDDDLESVAENQLAIVQATDLDTIPEIYSTIRESSPNLVAALTGRSCIYSRSERVKRAVTAELEVRNDTTPLFFNYSNVWLYSSEFPSIKISENSSYELLQNLSSASNAALTNDSMIVTMFFAKKDNPKVVTRFNFTMNQGYFSLSSLTYTDSNHSGILLSPRKPFFIPQNFSYLCSQDIIFSNESMQLSFKNMQIQLDVIEKFGDSYNCVGFTTIPIWTGIFVTTILALIMIWGLTMIMDIRTMDRFDDPKGKTITISAQE